MTRPSVPEGPPDRAERVLRAALENESGLGTVDPVAARRRADRLRHRRRGVGVLGAALAVAVLILGVVALPRWLPEDAPSTVAAPEGPGAPARPPADPAPKGWRTEYYRDLSFQVPADWGYAYAPASDWCVGDPKRPRPEHRRPYVSLGERSVVNAILCPAFPDVLLSEHALVFLPGPDDRAVDTTMRRGRWWVVQRVVSGAVLVVTSRDRARAERIAASAAEVSGEEPCPSNSFVQGALGARPQREVNLESLQDPTRVVVCQYDPDTPGGRGGLRASAELASDQADRLLSALMSARPAKACDPNPYAPEPDLALLVRVEAGGQQHDLHVQAAGCSGGSGSSGGIDDGRIVRELTRDACRALLVPPVSMSAASGGVAENCLE